MDPNAAWDALGRAIAQGDNEAAITAAMALLDWLAMGGFPPKVAPHGERFDACVAYHSCLAVLDELAPDDV